MTQYLIFDESGNFRSHSKDLSYLQTTRLPEGFVYKKAPPDWDRHTTYNQQTDKFGQRDPNERKPKRQMIDQASQNFLERLDKPLNVMSRNEFEVIKTKKPVIIKQDGEYDITAQIDIKGTYNEMFELAVSNTKTDEILESREFVNYAGGGSFTTIKNLKKSDKIEMMLKSSVIGVKNVTNALLKVVKLN